MKIRTPRRTAIRGYSVVELLTAISIIAVLIALLLPVIQRGRELTNASRTTANLQRLCKSAVESKQRTGKIPVLDSVWMDLGYPATAGYAMDGFALTVPTGSGDDKLELVAVPLPGVTGSVTLRVPFVPASVQGCSVVSTPIPSADGARTRMFNDLMATGALSLQRLVDLGLDPKQPGVTTNAVQANYIGTNLVAIQKSVSQPGAPPVTGWFVGEAFRIMRIGANGEQWTAFPDTTAITDGTSNTILFSLNGLETVTIEFYGNAAAAAGPLADLQAAKAAEARGDLAGKRAALTAFRAKVLVSGGAVTAPESAAIIAMADVLISS